MAKQSTAIIDFGSSTISVVIAEKNVNNSFIILGKSEMEYDGFMNGEFLKPNSLFSIISHLISSCEATAKVRVSKIYVGVPGEFASVVVKEVKVNFGSKRRITDSEIDELFEAGDDFNKETKYKLINRAPIFYKLDDERLIIEPRECKSTSLGGQLSYILADTYFINCIDEILNNLGIKKVEYISASLAQSLFLVDWKTRDKFALLIDVGYITTNVILMRGEGIIFLKSFSLGGGYIASDLHSYFKMPFSVAEHLKRKVALSLVVDENSKYDIFYKGEEFSFPAKEVNEVVAGRIEQISKFVNKCLDLCVEKYPVKLRALITGGGLSFIRGAKELMSKSLDREVEIASCNIPQMDIPNESSLYSLLNMALRQENSKKSIFSNIFN